MQYRQLGRSDLSVSALCLGSMTWGSQNTRDEAFAQLDLARAHGINFIDTAEMYPVNPVAAETCGDSEALIGQWLAARGGRDQLLIATKVTGDNPGFMRGGAGYDGTTLIAACEGSLRRLQTEVIDLYQLHWPLRGSYHFRQNWRYDPLAQDRAATLAHMEDVLRAAERLIADGKVRYLGLSNESAWGSSRWVTCAEALELPPVQTIQNEYSLLCRLFDTDLLEACHNEQLSLLAYSPLATGLLSGKYLDGRVPPGSRRSLSPDLNGRCTARVNGAVRAYLDIAREHGLDPCQMALAWCIARPCVGAAIIGATSTEQLANSLGAAELVLDTAVIEAIEAAHKAHPLPY